ncbi:hypothetical protein PR048_011381 [Dryococelus australis]|uniref:RNA-directed DNA polymerase n=1 Tax=Dryococelus australis TaxID=614101 RepID=A0ABQ9HLL1_9NEOP|nr:hypothetical protein PR048_011381 [Dryococelus australis]
MYVPGKYMYIADTLSRSALSEDKSFTAMESDLETHINLVIQQGWPDKTSLVKAEVQPFYKHRHEITVKDNLIFKDSNVVIPKLLRSDILRIIHEGHTGIEIWQQRARRTVFWPGINDIRVLINNCQVCQKYKGNQTKMPLVPQYEGAIPGKY